MPLYHIHLCGASDGANDPDGQEFVDDAAARDHVVASVRAMIADGMSATADCSAFVFELRSQDGQLVATVPFTQDLGLMIADITGRNALQQIDPADGMHEVAGGMRFAAGELAGRKHLAPLM